MSLINNLIPLHREQERGLGATCVDLNITTENAIRKGQDAGEYDEAEER